MLASYGHVRDLPKKGLGVDREQRLRADLRGPEGQGEDAHGAQEGGAASRRPSTSRPTRTARARRSPGTCRRRLKPGHEGRSPSAASASTRSPRTPCSPRWRTPGRSTARLVDAQQARRIIDRLVGYEVSDLLWKKIWRGLSAGRVQTVALRIICEREQEIEAFRPVEYWTLDARARGVGAAALHARLSSFEGEKLKFDGDGSAPRLGSEDRARPGRRREGRLARREGRDVGAAQDAAAALHHVAAPAGRRAPALLRRAPHDADRAAALRGARDPGPRHRRPDHLHAHRLDPRLRRGADGRARAHRPRATAPSRCPSRRASSRASATRRTRTRRSGRRISTCRPRQVEPHLAPEEAKLYRLIWERFVASQMNPAVYDTVSAEIEAGPAVYRASGSTLKFAGYLAAYGVEVGEDEDEPASAEGAAKLPPLTEGETLKLARAQARAQADAAAAALQRGLAREVPRGERHRPPLDVRRDPAQARAARVRPQEGPPLHPDGARPHGARAPDPVLRRLLRDRLHGADGGGARRGRGGQALLDQGALAVRQDVHERPQPRAARHGLGQGGDSARARRATCSPFRSCRRLPRSARAAARS